MIVFFFFFKEVSICHNFLTLTLQGPGGRHDSIQPLGPSRSASDAEKGSANVTHFPAQPASYD